LNDKKPSPIFDYAVVNGARVPFEQAQVSIFNKALWASFGVYETVKIDRGCPFYLEEHLHRLHQSAAMLDLGLELDITTLEGWFELLLEVDRQATWSLRIVALGASDPGERPIVAMQADVLPTYPEIFYEKGTTAVLYAGQRSLPMCKSLNTLVNYLARRTAHRLGGVEGLLHHDGYLTEGARSNLFVVRGGKLSTPPVEQVLSGITRDIILQEMRETDFPVVEALLPVDLSLYDELFITSTSMQVLPIIQVNDQAIGDGQVGPVTRLAMARFRAHYQQLICVAADRV
jgi:branched-subunit amino acid aminotransferase/4-amino-4-deoxychorismate lyase